MLGALAVTPPPTFPYLAAPICRRPPDGRRGLALFLVEPRGQTKGNDERRDGLPRQGDHCLTLSRMLAANDAAGQIVPVRPLRCHYRRHALKDIIAEHEVVKERSPGMANDQSAECVGTELMRQHKGVRQRRIRGHQWWNPPKEQSELMPPEQRVS